MVLTGYGNCTILMKQIIVSFALTKFNRHDLFYLFSFTGIIVGDERFLRPSFIIFFFIVKKLLFVILHPSAMFRAFKENTLFHHHLTYHFFIRAMKQHSFCG